MPTIDYRPFKKEVHDLIDMVDGDKFSPEAFVMQVCMIAKTHRVAIDAPYFGKQVCKLVMSGNARHAHRLVNSIGDKDDSQIKVVAKVTMKVAFKYSALAAFVLFVMWIVQKCGII